MENLHRKITNAAYQLKQRMNNTGQKKQATDFLVYKYKDQVRREFSLSEEFTSCPRHQLTMLKVTRGSS